MLIEFKRQGSCAVFYDGNDPENWVASFCARGLMKLLGQHIPYRFKGFAQIKFDESLTDGESVISCQRHDAISHFHWASDSGEHFAACSSEYLQELVGRELEPGEKVLGRFLLTPTKGESDGRTAG